MGKALHLSSYDILGGYKADMGVGELQIVCSVWDPHSTTLINELEKTQKFAGRVITKN